MNPPLASVEDGVGPVLEAGELAEAVITAIARSNAATELQRRASYVRVLVKGRCRVTRAAIEDALGRPFRLPADLELIMPSFKGVFRVNADEAVWEVRGL